MRMNWSSNLRLGRKVGYGQFYKTLHMDRGSRSPGTTGGKKVRCGKLGAMATIFGQKNH